MKLTPGRSPWHRESDQVVSHFAVRDLDIPKVALKMRRTKIGHPTSNLLLKFTVLSVRSEAF